MPDPQDRWEVVEEGTKKKWKARKVGGKELGYRTKDMTNCPTTDPKLKKWILDMIDWGQMVVEDMGTLREEVGELKTNLDTIHNELSELVRKG